MKQKTICLILAILSAVLILAGACLETLCVPLFYESEAHYFAQGAPLPTVAILLSLLGAVSGIVVAFLLPKERFGETPFASSPFPALPGAIASLSAGILLLNSALGILGTIGAIALLISVLYLLLCGFLSRVDGQTVALIGFSAIIGCALLNAYYYFDTSVEMNSPFKVFLQTALLFSMLYFTGELRFLLDRRHPHLYLALAVCTVSATLLASLSTGLAVILGMVTRIDYWAGAIVCLGFAVTVILRIIHLLHIPTPSIPLEMTEDSEETPEQSDTHITEGENE